MPSPRKKSTGSAMSTVRSNILIEPPLRERAAPTERAARLVYYVPKT